MKRALGPVQCSQLACLYYWNGNQWVFVSSNCSQVPNCTCPGPPPKPAQGTPPFNQFVQCKSTARKAPGKIPPATVRIRVSEDVEICLIQVPEHSQHKGTRHGKGK
jgi:hypothetical protein